MDNIVYDLRIWNRCLVYCVIQHMKDFWHSDVTIEFLADFTEVFPEVEEAIKKAEFIAIDTEFTGMKLSP